MSATRPAEEPAAERPCPICGAPRRPAHRPFCSPRCAEVDLQRWLSGTYVLPAAEEEGAPDPDDAGAR